MKKTLQVILGLCATVAVVIILNCGGSNDTNTGNTDCDPVKKCQIGETINCADFSTETEIYHKKLLTCENGCWDLSQCELRDPNDKCGNGVIDKIGTSYENCDFGPNFTKQCADLGDGYEPGTYSCNDKCTGYDASECKKKGSSACATIVSCVSTCADDTCKEDCVKKGSDIGKTDFSSLDACVQTSCSGKYEKTCMEEKCKNEYYQCYPAAKCGNGTIDEGESCDKEDENTKEKACVDISEDFRDINNAMCNSSCSGYDTYMCIGKDTFDCIQVYDCIKGCSGDTTCTDACMAKGYAGGINIYNTLMECQNKSCPTGDEKCLNEKCLYQFQNCKTHLSCGNKRIDPPYEICEKGESIDCGKLDSSKYEAGTADAYCGATCMDYQPTGCFGLESCQTVRNCAVDKGCNPKGGNDSECEKECVKLGTKKGATQYKNIQNCYQNCTDQNGGKDCDQKCTQDFPCDS